MNHQLIYGLNGCGKYTIVKTYINQDVDYDNKVYNMKNQTIELIFNGNKIDFTVLASHIILKLIVRILTIKGL